MSENKVGKLILKAKGNRSYREYQRETGVDAAVISKIVKGTYIPKNPEIYRKLTSCDSNGVTFEQLIDAAKYSSEYKDGMAAGATALQATLTAFGGASLAMLPGVGILVAGMAGATGAILKSESNKVKNIDKVEDYLKDIQRFSAISNGILFSEFVQHGIICQQNMSSNIRIFDNQLDTYLDIKNRIYSQYIIRYLYIDTTVNNSEKILEIAGRRMIEELVFSIPDIRRKVSIVTESIHVFEYLKDYVGKISYKGNLSLILINTQKVEFVEEEILAVYDGTVESNNLLI